MENENPLNYIRSVFESYYKEIEYLLILKKVVRNWYTIPFWALNPNRSIVLYLKKGSVKIEPNAGLMSIPTNVVIQREIFYNFSKKKNANGVIGKDTISFDFNGKRLKFIRNELETDTLRLINENFMIKEYNYLDVKGKDVVDIGASISDTAILFALTGARHVYAFEPYGKAYETMVQNIKLNGLEDKITPIKAGCGESKANKSSYSLADIIDEFNLNGFALKSDCEGCEYKIFLNASKDNLRKIDSGIMEFHNGSRNIVEKLRSVGFNTKILHIYSIHATGNKSNTYGILYFDRAK